MRLCGTIAAKWKSIGVQLGIPSHELDTIQANNRGDPQMVQNCLSDVFSWWLKTIDEQDMPQKLAEAIHIVGEHKVEVKIKQKFGKYVPSMTMHYIFQMDWKCYIIVLTKYF